MLILNKVLAKKAAGFEYRTLLGELLYAYITCRPDIGYAITPLSKFASSQPTVTIQNMLHYIFDLWNIGYLFQASYCSYWSSIQILWQYVSLFRPFQVSCGQQRQSSYFVCGCRPCELPCRSSFHYWCRVRMQQWCYWLQVYKSNFRFYWNRIYCCRGHSPGPDIPTYVSLDWRICRVVRRKTK